VRRAALTAALCSAGICLAATALPEPGAPDFQRALAISQAAIGARVGNHALRDSRQREVRLDQYRGKPLLVSFVYTGCFQVCPVTTQFLAKAVGAARAALGRDSFNVLTVGFNQPFDSPEAMGAFARQNGVNDPNWNFASPDAATLAALTRELGFTYYATPKGFDHITQLTLLDADGVVYRQIYGDAFELPLLADAVKDLLSGQASRAGGIDSVWTKVKLFCTVYDPASGGYRVNYSLFVEIFAGLSILVGIGWFLIREYRRRPRAA
jgi:protein SCO1/2